MDFTVIAFIIWLYVNTIWMVTALQEDKTSLHGSSVAVCISFFGEKRGWNLPRIPSSEGIKGVCGDNAPARQMLRDDPRQGHHIPAKPSVTPFSPPCWSSGAKEKRGNKGLCCRLD